jgi:hypothetical protein
MTFAAYIRTKHSPWNIKDMELLHAMQDPSHSTHSIADEKQFGLENVRYHVLPFQQKSRSI